MKKPGAVRIRRRRINDNAGGPPALNTAGRGKAKKGKNDYE